MMADRISRALLAAAVVLSALALLVSVTHRGPSGPTGPAGPPGPQGSTGHNAETAYLGICWNMDTYLNSGGTDWVGALTAPVLSAGTPSCPTGQFVSVVPQPSN